MRQAFLRDHDRAALRQLLERAWPGAASGSIERLADDAQVTRLDRGEVIFRQGESIPVTLVMDGYAAVRRTTWSGHEVVHRIAEPGDLFGEGIAGQLAIADLVAITPTLVGLWPGADVRNGVVTDPGLAVAVIDGLGRQVVAMSQRIDSFIDQNARGRVLRVLSDYRDLFFSEPPVLSRTLLPGLVGASREMTGRVIRGLEREGMIARSGRAGLRLLSPSALEEAADPAERAS
jgi:CRP-like cAMP-binding protein